MRTTLSLIALSALAAGCGGGGYCKKNAKLAEDCGDEVTDEELAECEEALEGCSAADEKKLEDFTDCLVDASGGDICGDETMTGTGDLFSVFACFADLQGISEECGAFSTGFTGSTTTDWTFTYTSTP